MRTARILIALSLLLLPAAAQTQAEQLVVATKHVVHSDAIGEDRAVWVHLPRGYDATADRYPVLLLLDGGERGGHMLHTTGTAQFLARDQQMPELIVVGVANTNRMRDMTPSVDENVPAPTQGGTADFLTFLCDELTPWVDAHYRTRPTRFLIGHSLGGLVALHALRTRTGFFAGMIAISPSMQWDDQHEAAEIETWLATDPAVDCALYMTAANEKTLVGGCYRTAGLFDVSPPKGLRWKFHHMPDETHASVPYRSTRDGFLFLFEGWKLADGAQAALDGTWDAAVARVARARARYGYEFEPGFEPILDAVYELASRNEADAAMKLVRDSRLPERGLPPELAAMFASMALDRPSHGDAPPDAAREALTVAFFRMAVEANPWQANARQALEKRGVALEPPAEHAVAAEQLAGCVGEFTHLREKLTLRLEDGHLVCRVDEGEPVRLYCKAPGEFFSAAGKRLVVRETSEGDGREVEYTDRWARRVFRRAASR